MIFIKRELAVYPILGAIARKFDGQVSLEIANSYLTQYGYQKTTEDELSYWINQLSNNTDTKETKLYQSVKTGSQTLNQVLHYSDKSDKQHYVNTRNKILSIDNTELDKICQIVAELRAKSPSHKVAWHTVEKACKKYNLVFSPSKNFKDLIERHLDNLMQGPSLGNDTNPAFTQQLNTDLGVSYLDKRFMHNYKLRLNRQQRYLADQINFSHEINKAKIRPRVIKQTRLLDKEIEPDGSSLVIVNSDWHIGATVNLPNNRYNYAIAQERVKLYEKRIVQAIKEKHPTDVYIVNLGDLIEGVQMRKVNQSYYTDMTLSDQIIKATQLQDSMLMSLATTFPKIQFHFTEIAGNHDRFSPSKKDQLYGDSVAKVARELSTSLFKDLDNMNVFAPDSEYRTILNLNKHNLAFVHGDLDKLNDNNALAKMSAFEKKPLDALVGGHLHSLMIKEENGYVIQSGSLIGPTEYSDRLGLVASASQVMLSIDIGQIVPIVVNL